MHLAVDPAILYFGTPVLLISTRNEDGSSNIAPMSSAWWLGWSCMLGLEASSQTTRNLRRTGECVLNLPSDDLAGQVDKLALLTGSAPVPPHKRRLGYRHCADKFAAAGFTAQPAECVRADRILECPVQLEARLVATHPFARADDRMAVPALALEVKILRAHVREALLDAEKRHRVDPDRWRPLIMSFRKYYGLQACEQSSRLAQGSESAYAPWRGGFAKRMLARAYRRWAEHAYAGE